MKINPLFLFLIFVTKIFCQGQGFEPKEWDHLPVKYASIIIPSDLAKNNVVIIDEKVNFNFTSNFTKTIQKTVLLKIFDKEGLDCLNQVSLPESFDVSDNMEKWQQGRLSKNKIPYIKSYNIEYFIARIIKPKGKVIDAQPKYSTAKIRWIKPSGEFMNDYVNNFSFQGLEVGDLIEYSYKADYNPNYGGDILYIFWLLIFPFLTLL